MQVTHVFQEDNQSGMFKEGRLEFLKMIELAEKREIDAVVVIRLDRLARDMVDAATTIKLLNAVGCKLLAGDDISDNQTPVGEFMRGILLLQNQYQARVTASRVMQSEIHNAQKGDSAGGQAPYGLKLINKKFEIDDNEAPAVKQIFNMISKGKSYKSVVNWLNDKGYRTRKGREFSYSTLNTLLRNEKYYGTYVYNREDGKRKKKRVLIEQFNEVRTAGAIPAIITKAQFDKVQKILDNRMSCRAHLNTSGYILTGHIFCKECNSSMSGSTIAGGRNKKRYRLYSCQNHKAVRGKTCSTKPINADYLEKVVKNAVTEIINGYLSDVQMSMSVFSKIKSTKQSEINNVQKRIDGLEDNINSLIKKATSPTTSQIVAKRYELQAEENIRCQEKLKKEVEQLKATLLKFDNIQTNFGKSEGLMVEDIFSTIEQSREIIDLFIQKIVVDESNDEIEIQFNL